jgi:uncharacterized protein YbaP (TraB family)
MLNVFSQQRTNYSLLWKISGNGLKKPSYLFGTMHVKDKRVFNFSDSVMLALQSCPRFALEVHPDTVMIKMFAMLQSNDTSRNLEKMFSKDQYDRMAKKFKEKHGYSMGKVDPILLESMMQPDDDKPDDQATFIDAHLYGIARTLNKRIFGLETAESQLDTYASGDAIKERILDMLNDDYATGRASGMDEMVKIYSTGDIDLIYKFAEESGTLDSVITARNKVMVSSMIKYMRDTALFTAVGAAHLPGPNGVIASLRSAGYNVTKVQASFTGIAGKYHVDYMKMNWPVYREEESGCSITFPGTAIKNTLFGIKNVVYPDLANGLYYGLSSTPKGTRDKPAVWKTVIAQTMNNLKANKKNIVLKRTDFLFENMPCAEILLKNASGYMRMRVLLANDRLFSVYAGAKVNHLHQPFVDRYLNSFKSFPIAEKPTQPWVAYSNAQGAFTVKFPVQPQPMVKEVPYKMQTREVKFIINMYISTDTINAKTYLVRYNDYPEGVLRGSRESVFNGLIEDFKEKGKIISGPVKIWKDDYEGREMKFLVNNVYYTTVRIYLRGNRQYILLKEGTLTDEKKANIKDPFFDSFKFIPYAGPVFYAYQPDSSNFKVQLLSKPYILPDSVKNFNTHLTDYITCFSTDPNSGMVYQFEDAKISHYYRVDGVDSLYKSTIEELRDYRDSTIKVDTVTLAGIKGREVLTVDTSSNIKKRTRIFISGEDMFVLTSKSDSPALFDKTSDAFYNSFELKYPSKKIDLASSKAEKICLDLASPDSITRKKAKGALSFYKFKPDELNYVYDALKKNYADDTVAKGARCLLVKQLEAVNNDTTIQVLSALYPGLEGKDQLRGAILETVPRINKKTGYDAYLKLLLTGQALKLTYMYGIFRPFNDSVSFAAEHFGLLLPYLKNDGYRSHIVRVATYIANEKNGKYEKMLRAAYPAITARAMSDLDNYIAIKDSADNKWGIYLYQYFQLMNKVHNEDINEKVTQKYLAHYPKGTYAVDAVIARINNGLPNNQLLVNKFLDSIGSRYDMMQAYADQKQLNRVPLKYKTQDAFAKLCLYQEISTDDYGSPEKIVLLGNIVKNGSVYYVFKYSLPEREEAKQLIAIVGPYKPGATKLNFEKYNAYTGYEVLKTNWRTQAAKMIKPLLEQYK